MDNDGKIHMTEKRPQLPHHMQIKKMKIVHSCQGLVSISQRSFLKTSFRKLVSLLGGHGS